MISCPVGAVQDTASDADVGVAFMSVTGLGPVEVHDTVLKRHTICSFNSCLLLSVLLLVIMYVFCVCVFM